MASEFGLSITNAALTSANGAPPPRLRSSCPQSARRPRAGQARADRSPRRARGSNRAPCRRQRRRKKARSTAGASSSSVSSERCVDAPRSALERERDGWGVGEARVASLESRGGAPALTHVPLPAAGRSVQSAIRLWACSGRPRCRCAPSGSLRRRPRWRNVRR